MKNVCATKGTTPGYDVSHYQPNLGIHAQMKAAGKKFCLIKATEGTTVVDSLFKAHWQAAKAAGMIVGAYNFFHPAQDPVAQAAHMESVIGKLGPGDLGMVLDWETTDGLSSIKDADQGLEFLIKIELSTGKTPIVYGAPYFLQSLGLDSRYAKFNLWVAHYGAQCPLVPPPWSDWAMWQFTDVGGHDLNLFNGDLKALQTFAGLTTT